MGRIAALAIADIAVIERQELTADKRGLARMTMESTPQQGG
jgi:hypothetical protein